MSDSLSCVVASGLLPRITGTLLALVLIYSSSHSTFLGCNLYRVLSNNSFANSFPVKLSFFCFSFIAHNRSILCALWFSVHTKYFTLSSGVISTPIISSGFFLNIIQIASSACKVIGLFARILAIIVSLRYLFFLRVYVLYPFFFNASRISILYTITASTSFLTISYNHTSF